MLNDGANDADHADGGGGGGAGDGELVTRKR